MAFSARFCVAAATLQSVTSQMRKAFTSDDPSLETVLVNEVSAAGSPCRLLGWFLYGGNGCGKRRSQTNTERFEREGRNTTFYNEIIKMAGSADGELYGSHCYASMEIQ